LNEIPGAAELLSVSAAVADLAVHCLNRVEASPLVDEIELYIAEPRSIGVSVSQLVLTSTNRFDGDE
jgi:hypothetical protein